jgi:hypothetical protein
MRLVISGDPMAHFRRNLAGLQERFETALTAAANMAASMIEQLAGQDIARAGRFGTDWASGLHVKVDSGSTRNMRISMTHDIPYASIFETGGVIHGNPFLWLPLSGTDAEGVRARDYPVGLFSAKYTRSGAPLLFSRYDKQPKYFGIESVTIPKLFHLNEIVRSVMGNFRMIFDAEFRGGAV